MQFNPTLGLSRFIGRRDGRRVPGRVPQELLISSLGPVLDLSTGGMRVLATRVPVTSRLEVVLTTEQASITLNAKVAWSRRLGFRRYEVGMSFEKVADEVAKLLSRISADHHARTETNEDAA